MTSSIPTSDLQLSEPTHTENPQNCVATVIVLTDRIHANQKSHHNADIIVDALGAPRSSAICSSWIGK